ncbi:MAG: signal peptide peptidase SppA [Acidobacteriaceae bacterium]|nr:signal peptide peptidase SppA [Acidobacteriaceae bacterium]
MWKFLLGVLIGIIVTVFGIFIVFLAVGRIFANKPPSVAGNSVLVLSLRGDIPETAPVDVALPFIQQQAAPTVRDLWTSLHAAASDNRIKAVVLEPHGVIAGWGRLEELRQEIVDFKRSGKPVYAFLESPGSREYYLASAADKIYLSPGDMLEVKGFLLEAMYFKNGLDKLGVQFEVDHIGRYKDAGDVFTRTNMSPETREVLGQVLDQIYGDFCSIVGQGRHKSADDMKAVIDMGPFTAEQAKSSGLIDQLGYDDELYADLKKKTGASKLNRVDIRSYFRAEPGRGDRIAMLVGDGDIVQGDPSNAFGGGTEIADRAFAKLIRQVRNDSAVKGVVLRVNSPGGDSLASDVILHELKLLSAAKPMVISMSDVAASGGYYISMTGDPVVSYPDTITGSIGVLYARPVVRGLFDKLGIQADLLSRGKLADMDSVTQPLSDAARQKLHESIESTYKLFVTKVATARKRAYDQIDQIAQGRVWMGTQARQNGLVDQLGGLDQAVTMVRQKAHLPPTGDTNLVMFPPRRSLLEVLANASPEALQDSAAESKLRQWLPALPSPQLLKGGLLRILPYRISVY